MPTSKKRQSKKNAATSSIADFKKRSGGLTELPSGLVVKLKSKGGMRAFMASGIIPNSLMGVIQEAINKGTEPDMSGLFKPDGSMDESMINDMMTLTDRVTIDTMVAPPVLPVPTEEDVKAWNRSHRAKVDQVENPDDLRDDDQLYIDEIPEEDKMFIFQWVTGGTRDVEQFRKELTSSMDDVARLQNVPSATKRASAARRR